MESAVLRPPSLTAPDTETLNARVAHVVMGAASFAALYDEHVTYIHRGVRRLGVDSAAVEDVVQEVFLTAYRSHSTFRGESSIRTWLFGIALRVVRLHRRTTARAGLHGIIDRSAMPDLERVADKSGSRPDEEAEKADAWRILMRVLDELDQDKREIFVLVELEEMPIPEIAVLLDIKPNTAYSRLRLARAAFESALARLRAGETA